jgi:DNA-directed RNA polymerase subunit N (RpoN/RPB10)
MVWCAYATVTGSRPRAQAICDTLAVDVYCARRMYIWDREVTGFAAVCWRVAVIFSCTKLPSPPMFRSISIVHWNSQRASAVTSFVHSALVNPVGQFRPRPGGGQGLDDRGWFPPTAYKVHASLGMVVTSAASELARDAGSEGNKVQLSIASRICLLESGEMVLRAEIRFLLFQPASYARCIPHNICAHCWVLHTLPPWCALRILARSRLQFCR